MAEFWRGVTDVRDGAGRVCWRLPDGRIVTQAEMRKRELLFLAGQDADSGWSPEVDKADDILGPIVAMERVMRHMSQRDLASVAGVSQSMVARLERGVREPSWRTFRLLLEAMNLEPVVDVREIPATDG